MPTVLVRKWLCTNTSFMESSGRINGSIHVQGSEERLAQNMCHQCELLPSSPQPSLPSPSETCEALLWPPRSFHSLQGGHHMRAMGTCSRGHGGLPTNTSPFSESPRLRHSSGKTAPPLPYQRSQEHPSQDKPSENTCGGHRHLPLIGNRQPRAPSHARQVQGAETGSPCPKGSPSTAGCRANSTRSYWVYYYSWPRDGTKAAPPHTETRRKENAPGGCAHSWEAGQ